MWLGVLLILVVALVGCAGQGAYGQPSSGTGDKVQTASGPTAAETAKVTMAKSFRFDPTSIRVPVGTTVTWTNDDSVTHDVRFLGGTGWRSQPLRPGESATFTFTEVGEYAYECGFHPSSMKGKVIVEAR